MSSPVQFADGVYAVMSTLASLRDCSPFPSDVYAAGQFNARRATEYVAARLLLRRLVSELARPGLAASPILKRSGGRPFLAAQPEIGISLSHTDGWVAAAVNLYGQVGVDVQAPISASGRLRRRCCTPSAWLALTQLPETERNREFSYIWAAQESCVKATGMGISGAPWSIPVEMGQVSGIWNGISWSAPRNHLIAFACAYRVLVRLKSNDS